MRLGTSGMKRLLALTAMGLWGTACTTAMYSGSRRSSDEVAVLITTNGQVMMDGKSQSGVSTRVAKIDGSLAIESVPEQGTCIRVGCVARN